jgi:hypothetical protein
MAVEVITLELTIKGMAAIFTMVLLLQKIILKRQN